MARPTSVLAALGVWGATVALAASGIWLVIARAGERVVGATMVAPTAAARPPATTAPPSDVPPSPSATEATGEASAVPEPVSDTWSGTAGVVNATCEGTQLTVRVIPSAGWKTSRETQGPSVRVEFERADDTQEVKILVSCQDGTPVFR